MKHSWKITIIVLMTFLLAQFIGIGILYNYIDAEKSAETGKTEFKDLPLGERPPLEEGTSFLPIMLIILIGTAILFLLIRYKLTVVWKIWFLIAVIIALTVAWSAFVRKEIAFLFALGFGLWKIFRPNVWVHNLTELFVYGGLAAIFAPMFNLWSVIILLILISGYDAYAVWKSKHMIKLAKSQAKAKVFAGLLIPYRVGKVAVGKVKSKVREKVRKKVWEKIKKVKLKAAKKELKTSKIIKIKPSQVRTAVLGGGDIGFPLIFAGVILKDMGLWQSLIIPFGALLGLAVLMWKGDQGKFYPAMPFISVGCFLALGIVMLAGLF